MAGLWEIIVPFAADDVNECTNPSLELNTTGWSTGGTNTLAQSAEQQYRGRYSAKITYSNSTTLLRISPTLATQNTTYYLKAKLFVPTTWDGGNISFSTSGFTSATETDVKVYTDGTSTQGAWVELVTTLAVVTDVAGTIDIVASSAPSGGKAIYVDAVYFSTNNGEYFDGDDDMAHWVGNRHASTSQMDFRNRQHGEAINLDDLNVYCGAPVGFDFTPPEVRVTMRSLGDGGEYQSTYIPPRTGQLPINVVGTSENNYHSTLKTFQNAIKSNRTATNQPFILRSLAANSDKPNLLACRLASDMNLERRGFEGLGALRIIAEEPAWFEGGDNYLSMNRFSTLTASYIFGYLNGTGFDNLGNAGTGSVNVIITDEAGDVYVGHTGLNWDGIANADYLAKWDKSADTWSALFSPADGQVRDLLFLDDGDLIIVGNFTNIAGSAINRAARWNGAAISGFGTGFNGQVNKVLHDYKRNILYFGGIFTTANGVSHPRVVQYDLTTSTFSTMSGGIDDGTVNDMYLDIATGNVYIGGSFVNVGGGALAANYIVRWHYSSQQWHGVGNPLGRGLDSTVNTLAADDKFLYMGGFFQNPSGGSGSTLKRIARWRFGSLFIRPVGSGMDNTVTEIVYDNGSKRFLITGLFSDAGGVPVNNAAWWNGSTFEPSGFKLSSGNIQRAHFNPDNGDYFISTTSSSATVTVPSALNSVTNNGTTNGLPVFYFDSLGTAVTTDHARLDLIENTTTGKRLTFNTLNLLEGALIIVDVGRQRVYRLVGQTFEDITEGVVARDADWSDFALIPGSNELLLSAPDITGSPTIAPYLLWRNRHHSISGTAT